MINVKSRFVQITHPSGLHIIGVLIINFVGRFYWVNEIHFEVGSSCFGCRRMHDFGDLAAGRGAFCLSSNYGDK